jgi:hypothetical protein
VEASLYIKRVNQQAKIASLNRLDTISLIDSLYKIGAMSVEISEMTDNTIFALRIRVPNLLKIRETLVEIFKTNPNALEEVRLGIFVVRWK